MNYLTQLSSGDSAGFFNLFYKTTSMYRCPVCMPFFSEVPSREHCIGIPMLDCRWLFFSENIGVLHGSVVRYLNHNPEVLGSSHTGSSWTFMRVSLAKTLQIPRLVLGQHSIDTSNVSYHHDMTEIMLKMA